MAAFVESHSPPDSVPTSLKASVLVQTTEEHSTSIHHSSQNSLERVNKQSMVLRTPMAQTVIHAHYQRGAIATLELRGSIFFLSSLKILDEVRDVLMIDAHGTGTPAQRRR